MQDWVFRLGMKHLLMPYYLRVLELKKYTSFYPRMTFALESMISLFEKMFGNLFWKNTLFEVTRWHFDQRSERNRLERGESIDKWQQEWNSKFHRDFDIDVRLSKS